MAFWAMVLVRAFAAFVALLLVREAIPGLRGRPVIVPSGSGAREYQGWPARIFGAMALFFALFLSLFAIYAETPQ